VKESVANKHRFPKRRQHSQQSHADWRRVRAGRARRRQKRNNNQLLHPYNKSHDPTNRPTVQQRWWRWRWRRWRLATTMGIYNV